MHSLYKYPLESKYKSSSDGFELYVTDFSNNLKTYGQEILKGDFKIFNQLEKVIRKRIAKYNK